MADSSDSSNSPDSGIGELSYEEARSRLVEIVTRLEQGSISLEESLALWEQGEALARHCQSWLDGARKRLQAAQEQSHTAPASTGTHTAPASSGTHTGTSGTHTSTTSTTPTSTAADASTAHEPDSEDLP